MARKKRGLIIRFSPEAERNLNQIIEWTASSWGNRQAVSYATFILNGVRKLSTQSCDAPVDVESGTQYAVLRSSRKRGSHGYVVFFVVSETTFDVIRIVHTASDWKAD